MLKEISQGREKRLDSIVTSQTKSSENTPSKKTVFLAAGGYFQEEYIALFEELTNMSPAVEETEINEYDNARFIADVFFDKLRSEYKLKEFNFNKIFSVTIPSQIIAKFLYERLEKEYYQNQEIRFYSNKGGTDHYERELPLLIRLSSYYSFDEEINFRNIKAGDRVLIINDVISTGNLINNIINSIANKVFDEDNPNLKARIEKILSVVDTRLSESEIDSLIATRPLMNKDDICRSVYFNVNPYLSESNIISLRKKLIAKFRKRPEHLKEAKLIRINPILNAPVTFPTRHSEEDKIAFKNPIEFLEMFPSQDLKIGHFHQNSLHHSYFIKPNDLFKKNDITGITNENGIKLFQSVISRVHSLEHSIDVNYYLESLTLRLDALKLQSHLFDATDERTIEQFENAKKEITKIKNFVEIDKNHNLNPIKNKLKVDFVFRPVFSGIELLTRNDITEFCDVATHNIIELHRFDTIKGWRFIIPPKYLNNPLVNKTALVIDMGSFTGDSIIQMVDALSVYQLSKIIVVSLVGRIEDFDREFLSRMREIKVKRRKCKTNDERGLPDNTIASINIYFGTNIHIPPYPSIKVCKFCNETEKIATYLGVKECTSPHVRNYISKRLDELKLLHVGEIQNQCPTYFPENRNQEKNKFDTLTFYKIRDDLGKIDGYRFYENYYDYFDELIADSATYNQDMEAIMAICLHETHLLTTIRNQLPDIYSNLQLFIQQVIDSNEIESLHYHWHKKELLKFHLIINESKLLDDGLIKILEFADDCELSNNQLLFFIWEKHYDYRKEINKRFSIYEFRDNVFEAKKKITQQYEELIKEIINICDEFEYNAFSDIDLSFYKLKLFFNSEASYNSRPSSLSSGLTTHPSIYNAVNGLKTPLNRCESDQSNYLADVDEFQQNWNQKKERLQHELIKPLNKLTGLIKSSDTHGNFEFLHVDTSSRNINVLLKSIDDLIADLTKNNLLSTIKKVKEVIDEIMRSYLSYRSDFAKFCVAFLNFNPISLLKTYFDSEDFLGLRIPVDKLRINITTEEIIGNYLINLHPLILQCVYKEIFDNYNQYSEGSEFVVEDSIVDSTFILKFTQSSKIKEPQKPKTENTNKICFINLENNLLSTFGISFYSNKGEFYNEKTATKPETFIQELKIPIFKSFKNDSI